MTIEKRAHKRFAFPKKSKITATLISSEGKKAVEAVILNVSKGGVGLAAEKQTENILQEEIELFIESVAAGAGLPCLKGQRVRVKWVLDYDQLENLGVGCEFVDLKEDCQQELEALFS